MAKATRKIVKINEDLCTGCGLCIPGCKEGALQIINGKARLIREQYCDGLGACLGECPQGAITIEERPAEEFNEEVVEEHLKSGKPSAEPQPCACPSTRMAQFNKPAPSKEKQTVKAESMLTHWPVQLRLVPPKAPFFQDADLLLTADCVPFAYAGFHQDFLRDHAVVVACPKLDDYEAHLEKLTAILNQSDIRSLTIVHMEVPCCYGLVQLAKQAVAASGKVIPFADVTIGVEGEKKAVSSK